MKNVMYFAIWLLFYMGAVVAATVDPSLVAATVDPSVVDYISERAIAPAADLPRWYILTGGTCVGKTTLIEHFVHLGHAVVPEAAKAFILAEQAKGVAEPWKLEGFQSGISVWFDKEMEKAKKLAGVDLCFFDRGPVDSIMYHLHRGQAPEDQVVLYTGIALREQRFQCKVFLLEELPADCFENTSYRPEDPEESRKIGAWMEKGYRDLGFTIIRIPAVPVEERAKIILRHIEMDKKSAEEGF